MSVLDTPRVYFRGQMTWDPMVTNNLPQLYDLSTGKPKLDGSSVAGYREKARQEILQGNWNMHGTHRSTFVETTVSGIDRGRGLETDDAVVGVPVSLTGMLVDLDTYGSTSSQLYFDRFSCGIDGGSQVLARRAAPMVARRLNFARNMSYRYIAGVASAVWQTSFPIGDGLSIEPRGSATLEALAEALHDDGVQGLTVRFNAYRTVYYGAEQPTPEQAQALADQIAAGGFHPNPARSVIVGVIGPWRTNEPPSVPGERVLARAPGSNVSSAFAKLRGHQLTVDLSNSVPETDFDLEKADLGPLAFVARTGGGEVSLGTLPYTSYDTAAYNATSGITELALDQAQASAAANGDLAVRAGTGALLLREQPLTACADPPSVYLEEGESAVVRLRAFERGGTPSSPVSITLAEMGGPLPPLTVETNADGEVTVPVNGNAGGSWTWVLLPWRGTAPPLPSRLVPDEREYVTLRVTPADAEIAVLEPTWENVHTYVLGDWEALAPAMDNWLRLGDEEQCRAYAPLIRELTSRDRFDDYRYMPVTRDLSRGQRTLLHRWCDAVVSGVLPPLAPEEALVAAQPERHRFGRGF